MMFKRQHVMCSRCVDMQAHSSYTHKGRDRGTAATKRHRQNISEPQPKQNRYTTITANPDAPSPTKHHQGTTQTWPRYHRDTGAPTPRPGRGSDSAQPPKESTTQAIAIGQQTTTETATTTLMASPVWEALQYCVLRTCESFLDPKAMISTENASHSFLVVWAIELLPWGRSSTIAHFLASCLCRSSLFSKERGSQRFLVLVCLGCLFS